MGGGGFRGVIYRIAMFLVTSPIVINVPTRGLLAVETVLTIVQWLENLNIKRNMTSMVVNKKHRYRPFPSSLVPLSKCETILTKITLICMKMKLHAELIYI